MTPLYRHIWTALIAMACTSVQASLLATDDFSDGDRTANPAWYINAGTFNVASGEANNNNSTFNQFFTTAFTATDLAENFDGFRLTLSYRPEGANIGTVRVGLFQGDAPTADSWDQWTAGRPTRDWRGYLASIGINGTAPTEIRRNDNAADDHAFFNGTTIGAAGSTINTAGSTTFRWIRFEMYRNQDEMILEAYEGPTLEGLVSLGQVTDSSAPFFSGFNNLAFYHTTGDAQNGHIRYDNIMLEATVIPEPGSVGFLVLGAVMLAHVKRGMRRPA